jgi:hypothetical protein
MSLIYVLVAHGKSILCDYSEYKGSFLQICNSFLSKVEPETSASFIYKDE